MKDTFFAPCMKWYNLYDIYLEFLNKDIDFPTVVFAVHRAPLTVHQYHSSRLPAGLRVSNSCFGYDIFFIIYCDIPFFPWFVVILLLLRCHHCSIRSTCRLCSQRMVTCRSHRPWGRSSYQVRRATKTPKYCNGHFWKSRYQ